MGKVLVERLLSTCPDIGRVHLLMRDKRDQPPAKRLQQLKQSQVFEVVRSRCPHQLDKLFAVRGDVSLPALGLTPGDAAALREVSLVFHAAATLKFDEPLSQAVAQNVRSVDALLTLCDELPALEAFVHVSTAYCNAELSSVRELVYPPPQPVHSVYSLVDAAPADLLAQITPQYIMPKPNTYTFTKALAESVIAEHRTHGRYSCAIFRPTVVVSSMEHPFPGWIENLNGPSGIVVGTGKGLMRVVAARENARADMLPVDLAIDTLIAVAWETAMDRPEQVRVYNCSTYENPTTWREFRRALQHYLLCHPLDNVFWCPIGYCVENKYAQKLLETVLQTVPLHTAEYITKIFGIKTKLSLIKVNQRLKAMNDVLRFFSVREWHFHTDNVRRLHARLSPEDAAIYNLDPQTIVWDDLYRNFVKGTRKYLLQEKDQDIECARKHLQKMLFVHYGLMVFVLTLVGRLLLTNIHLRDFVYRTVRMLLMLLYTAYLKVKQIS